MATIPHSVSKLLSTEHNLLQLSIIVSCRRQSENTNSRIQAVKIWFLKFLSQIILIFFKQTNSLWHWCHNISGLEWFCCFHYCHQSLALMSQHKWLGMILLFSLLSSKKEGVFSLLQVVHLVKSKRRKTFRIIETVRDNISTVPFFPESVGKQFLYVMCRYTIFPCV